MSTSFTIAPSDDRTRLDKMLLKQYPDVSRAFLQSLCKSNQVLVNGTPEKSGYRLRWGDHVEMLHDMDALGKTPDIELPILYEDGDVIVIDKPAGVLSHGLSTFKNEPSVASFLRQYSADSKQHDGTIRYGIVHRLDRQTSGVMICAKHSSAQQFLQAQFADRSIKKEYIAVCSGIPKHASAVIDIPIERNPNKPATFRPGTNGKVATTKYSVVSHTSTVSLLSLLPTTGRTHQLRVHLQYIGCPIIGDVLYGKISADRMMLHARSITIMLPSGKYKTFTADTPVQFLEYMNHSEDG